MLTVKINGNKYQAEKGEYIMEVARRNRILIPSFCHHEAMPGLGCCRLCIVEVKEKGKSRVVVSCVYPIGQNCEVFTESEKIKSLRRTILSMLRGRAPEGNRIASLCKMYGVADEDRYSPLAGTKGQAKTRMNTACILCGLCVEACSRLGTGAISSVGRGTGKKISTPYDEPSADCIGCGSCAAVCPTGAIICDEGDESRTIWGKTFSLIRCEKCGRHFTTKEELEYSAKRYAQESGMGAKESPGETEHVCENCRRKKISDVFAKSLGV